MSEPITLAEVIQAANDSPDKFSKQGRFFVYAVGANIESLIKLHPGIAFPIPPKTIMRDGVVSKLFTAEYPPDWDVGQFFVMPAQYLIL